MLKALTGSSWRHDKDTLLWTYNALGKSIASYAAPVWSTNASDSSFKKIQTAQKIASIDQLHQESLTLRVKDHADMLSAQYLVNCLRDGPRQSWHHNSRAKNKTHEGDSPLQSTEEVSTPNIRRGAETQPKTTMHSLTATVRTLPSIAGLQA